LAESDGNVEYGWAPIFGENPDAGFTGLGAPSLLGPPQFAPPPRQMAPVVRPPPIVQSEPPPFRPAPLQAYGGMGDFGAAAPAPPVATPPVPEENGHTLGLAILLTGIGGAIGGKYAGLFGGAAGALYGGAAMNAIRAGRNIVRGTPEADKEAMVSATWAIISAGVATYIWVKAEGKGGKGGKKKGHKNPDEDDAESDDEGPDEDESSSDDEEQESEE